MLPAVLLVIRGCVAAEIVAVALRTAMTIQCTVKNGTDIIRAVILCEQTHREK